MNRDDEILNFEPIVKRTVKTGLTPVNDFFILQTANKWIEQAKKRPIPKMLFSEFWYQGELCILFADTGLGKTILAVQIADNISKGESIPGFKNEIEKQKIIYFDFELTDKQFENRYSEYFENHYCFDDNFLRVELNPDSEIDNYEDFEDYLIDSIEKLIINTDVKILFIDNITYLRNETEKSKNALPLMKRLKKLKSKYSLSILALAHTPKRDMSKPINKNDLAGSKMLMNFCDSSFAIGESTNDKAFRYLKQIKERNKEKLYGIDNICLCQITKPENFTQFEFIKFDNELNHLKQVTEQDKNQIIEQVVELNKKGLSLREIAEKTSISHMKVKRIIDKNENNV